MTFEISGKITLLNEPVENAKVFLINDTDDTLDDTATTDANGNYTFNATEGKQFHIAVQYDDGTNKYNGKSMPFIEEIVEES